MSARGSADLDGHRHARGGNGFAVGAVHARHGHGLVAAGLQRAIERHALQALAGLNQLLPQELDGQYPSHWRVNHSVLQQVRQLVAQMEQQEGENDLPSTASREILFMQLLLLLRKSSLQENLENSASRLNLLLAWLEDHFADEVNWDAVADQFSLSLRTLHRQLKQQTGLTPQRYLNRLRLMKARHLLRHSEASVTDIAYRCGFSDSNHFSTLFRREFNWSPRDIRQGRDGFLQ